MKMTPISKLVWTSRYRLSEPAALRENDVSDSWRRVARAVASVEADARHWEAVFYSALSDFAFLPGGRILAGAGTGKRVTLFNCFVSGPLQDSLENILDSLKEAAVTMQHGGGIGCDFSPLRPAGSPAVGCGALASGPVSFMRLWDALCETLQSTTTRRGAMMGTLRCDHPDIQAFIDAKREHGALSNFNLSVLITDEFMRAVSDDALWALVYPPPTDAGEYGRVSPATGTSSGNDRRVWRQLPARELWRHIIRAAHATAEPGLLFIDRVNRNNNLYYCENISATNPCGEIPLPAYGACNLGSINLTALVRHPFSAERRLDRQSLRETVKVAVRFLDNVIDVSLFPVEQQAEVLRRSRRIGIGITGLADTLAMLGLHYDSDAARNFAQQTVELVRNTAYEASLALAREKGAFPALDKARYLEAPFVRRLPAHLRSGIERSGIRNSHLLAIAPAGTISLLADNVSSGIEPVFALDSIREIRDGKLKIRQVRLRDYAYRQWLAGAAAGEAMPAYFVTVDELPATAHLAMQACLQPFVDQGISKTVNLAADATVEDVARVYSEANALGVKGCTVFRPGLGGGQVIRKSADAKCCSETRQVAA